MVGTEPNLDFDEERGRKGKFCGSLSRGIEFVCFVLVGDVVLRCWGVIVRKEF